MTDKDDCECGLDENGNWSDEVFDRYGCGCEKEESFEDRFALKVKRDTRLKLVRVFKKETIEIFKKMNLKRKKEEK